MRRWVSGLNQRTANASTFNRVRKFESFSPRQYPAYVSKDKRTGPYRVRITDVWIPFSPIEEIKHVCGSDMQLVKKNAQYVNMPWQLRQQSRRLKISVSEVRVLPRAPTVFIFIKGLIKLINQSFFSFLVKIREKEDF